MEWANKYNSFNSMKGLSYYAHYQATVDWLDGDGKLPPPIECNLDPFAECNLNCYFCIGQRYLKHNRQEVGEMRKLPIDYMIRLVGFLANWGVRGLCISGGGEPTLHNDIPEVIQLAHDFGMDVSLVTNGVHMTDEIAEAMMLCRWVSFSVDAATHEEYKAIKGKSLFSNVMANISKVSEMRKDTDSNVDLCYKFLILPENQNSIYVGCKIAKQLRVQDFHARPVDFERSDIEGHRQLPIDIGEVGRQFELCHELEDEGFHVYTVTHKFDPEFHVKHDFTQCFPTLIMPLLTDGNIYLCVDKKMEANFKVGSAFPNPESILDSWGSDSHRKLVKSVDINQCSRCTGSQYNAQIEQVILQDKMCLSFP